MRIGIDIRTVAASAGQQRYLWRLATWLADRGETVEVLSLKSSAEGVVPHPNRTVHDLRGLSGRALRTQVRALGLDVFFANPERARAYAGLPMHVLRPGYGTRQGVQNLRSIRNPLLRASYALARQTPWEISKRRTERAWYRQRSPVPHVVAISEVMAQAIQADYGIAERQIHRIHNGVDLAEFSPERRRADRDRERARFGISADAFCVLFVGHNFRRKGLPELISALSRLGPDAENLVLLVAGRGTGEAQRRHLRSWVERAELVEQVVVAGDVVPVTRAYAAADALVFPSWHDAFGFVVLEAMACGLPVVTTRWAGAHEVVRPGEDGFVLEAPDDLEHLCEALRVLQDPRVCARMGIAARQQAEQFGEAANFAAVHRVIRTAGQSLE
ncbi:MAG: glycosyltransferase family 4 protein [Gemmatimonadota bacterium]